MSVCGQSDGRVLRSRPFASENVLDGPRPREPHAMNEPLQKAPYPIPEDERARLRDLRSLDLLDTPREPFFDGVVEIAAALFGVPFAALSLVDAERQWFKAAVGVDVCETGRDVSFCAHAIMGRDAFVVEDALARPALPRQSPGDGAAWAAILRGRPPHHAPRRPRGEPLRAGRGAQEGGARAAAPSGAARHDDRRGARVQARRGPRSAWALTNVRPPATLGFTLKIATARRVQVPDEEPAGARPSATHRPRMENDPNIIQAVEADPVLQIFLNSVTDQAVFTLDPEGIIATWNSGCERLKGYSAEEAIGRHYRMLYTEEDQVGGLPERNLTRAREEGQYHEEGARTRKGGGRFQADVSIYPIQRDGRLAGYAKVVRDVTERARRERERAELQERLERANRDLDQFSYSAAHDLRAPLRSIVSTSRVLLEDEGDRLSEEGRDALQRQARSAVRLAKVVDDLLDFARLADAEPRREPFDMTELARGVADEVRERRGARTSLEVQAGMRAEGDPSLVGYALTNLVDNAVKFAGGEGTVWIGEEGGAFFVRDEGPGFDMAHAAKLFVAFGRLVGQEVEGSGVGLANVRRIVEKHGGRAWAESAGSGTGATFWFTLG